MSENSQYSEVMEGCAELAQKLVADWTPYLTGLSTKMGSGSYGPGDASSDFSALAKLALNSLYDIGSKTMDAISIATLGFTEEETIGGYHTDPAKAGGVRTLKLKGDLKSVCGLVLPQERVTLVPDSLVPSATQFDLEVDKDGMKARTYDGYVLATDQAGVTEEIFVSVMLG